MQIIIDTREQSPLEFTVDMDVVRETVDVGDYACRTDGGVVLPVRIERKSIADLFSSFSSGYENEKAKIVKAKSLGYKYILAIEGTAFDVREGHEYRKDGEVHQSRKDGLSQVRQLMTMYSKSYFDIWWCKSRREMAFLISEYFYSQCKLLEA